MEHYVKAGFGFLMPTMASFPYLLILPLDFSARVIAPPSGWHAIILPLLRLLGFSWLTYSLVACISWCLALTSFGHCPMAYALTFSTYPTYTSYELPSLCMLALIVCLSTHLIGWFTTIVPQVGSMLTVVFLTVYPIHWCPLLTALGHCPMADALFLYS